MSDTDSLLGLGLASMLKGGVIMDVTNTEQAEIAERSGACAVMALERIPADIRKHGAIARMTDPAVIKAIMSKVTIPVMAKARIGHFAEAQILQAVGVDFIDESEVLTIADTSLHIDKSKFKVPFVCGCRSLPEALRRIKEGASMIRTKGDAGTGDIAEAIRHVRKVTHEIGMIKKMSDTELDAYAELEDVPLDLLRETIALGRLPVVTFAAGGIATPADAALLMQLGVDGVFVGSGIFKSQDPEKTAKAIVSAVLNYGKPEILAQVSAGLGSMP